MAPGRQVAMTRGRCQPPRTRHFVDEFRPSQLCVLMDEDDLYMQVISRGLKTLIKGPIPRPFKLKTCQRCHGLWSFRDLQVSLYLTMGGFNLQQHMARWCLFWLFRPGACIKKCQQDDIFACSVPYNMTTFLGILKFIYLPKIFFASMCRPFSRVMVWICYSCFTKLHSITSVNSLEFFAWKIIWLCYV